MKPPMPDSPANNDTNQDDGAPRPKQHRRFRICRYGIGTLSIIFLGCCFKPKYFSYCVLSPIVSLICFAFQIFWLLIGLMIVTNYLINIQCAIGRKRKTEM